jgi:hypothetical protein
LIIKYPSIGVLISSEPLLVYAQECPLKASGQYSEGPDKEIILYETQSELLTNDSDASFKSKLAIARMKAIVSLDKNPLAPRDNKGQVRGVVFIGSCRKDNKIFATVMVSKKTLDQAIELERSLSKNIVESEIAEDDQIDTIQDQKSE